MKYAILCDARCGGELSIDALALVDRSIDRGGFWTSDRPAVVRVFDTCQEAQQVIDALRFKNGARVVSREDALETIRQQREAIQAWTEEFNRSIEDYDDDDPSWDAHKSH